MSRLLRAVAAVAVLAIAAGTYAFVRSTTGSPGNLPLFWRSPQVTYFVNMGAFTGTGCGATGGPAAAAALARQSFPAWSNATRAGESKPCTDFKFVDGGDSGSFALGNDQVNLVVMRKGLCSVQSDPLCSSPPLLPDGSPDFGPCAQKFNCWSHDNNTGTGGILALTTATFVVSTGEILDADMELNGWNGNLPSPTGFYFTCAPPGSGICAQSYGGSNCIEFDVGNTVTHEAGHMLGLDHVCVTQGNPACHPEDTMAPTATAGDTNKRTLAADDIEGVCTIYPAGGSSSGGGCGAGGGGVLSLAAAALFLGWRRRRAA